MKQAQWGSSRTLQLLRGKRILITGTTGFVGKVVLEKLLRSAPDIENVHLLIRGNSKHSTARSRFNNEIATSSVFEHLKLNAPDYFEEFCQTRVHCITGEVTEPRFGLSRREFRELAKGVDAIINCAASVNFREELDHALAINTLSLRNIVDLSEAAGNIPVVQISTCYVNGFNEGAMHETVVTPAHAHLRRHREGYYEVEALIDELEEKIAELHQLYDGRELKARLVELGIREAQAHGWNDTYTFTKWLGEQLLLKALRGYSLTILRPSIVESTLQEPAPGWIEGVKVADAILLAYAREKVVFFPGKRDRVIDVIPADLVANSILLSLAEQFDQPGEHHIYQCCSGSRNPLTLGTFIGHLMDEARENHASYDRLFRRRPRKPFIAVDKRVFNLVTACLRRLLVSAEQLLSRLRLNSELRARRNLDAAIELSNIFSFYAEPNYVFHNDALLALAERMGSTDQLLFPVDAAAVNWEKYLRKVHIAGLNRYALGGSRLYHYRARTKTATAGDATRQQAA